jgi:PKD repeat protein
MKSHHYLTILKGTFITVILLLFVLGCSKKDEEIDLPPVAKFSFSPVSPKINDEVTFLNSSTNATSYKWTAAGTSFNSTEQSPKYTFTTAGDFNVKLVATGAGGINEITSKVTVTATAPVAAFSFSPTSPLTGEEVTFTNTSTDATSYQWSATGTSFSSTEQNPKFTFSTAGDFNVKLVATGLGGTNEVTKTITVTAAQVAPVAAFSFSPTSPVTGEEVTFTNASTNADSYQWSAAGTSFSSTDKNPKFTFDSAGDFEVKLVVTNSAGTDEITKTITVTAAQVAPVAAFSFSPTSPVTGEEVTFTNASTNADSYQWSAAGTSFSSTDKNPKFTFDSAGDFEVKLIVTNSAGTDEITKTITVTAAQVAPIAAFSFSPTSPEVGEVVTFTNESTNADSYQWSAAGTSFSSTDKNPKFTFDSAGDFEVKLVVTNSAGTDEIIKTITVTAAQVAPVAAFSYSPTSPEIGEVVTFTNESTNADSYQWSAAGTSFNSTEMNPTFTFDTAGDYEVKLVVTNASGKTNTSSKSTASTDEIIKTITVKDSGGNSNACNLPDCYVEKTTTVSLGTTTTINYGYSVINGTKKMSSITTATGYGNLVVSIQYDTQGRRIKDESRFSGALQNYTEYEYSNNNQNVKVSMYDAGGTLTGYSLEQYNANKHLTRSEGYSPAGVLTGYVVYSNFLNTDGSFPQLVETFDANNTITQTDVHTYEDCNLKRTVSRDGSGTVIGEVNNTIDSNRLLRTSVATIIAQGTTIKSTTQYVYDCD